MNFPHGRTGFIAYPSDPSDIGQCIESAVKLTMSDETRFGTWRSLEIGGQLIPSQVHEGVSSSSVFVADITYLNLNVAYEIGVAVGKGTPIVLIKNSTLAGNHNLAHGTGIFDTIGHDTYSNSQNLASLLQQSVSRKPLVMQYALNPGMPVYTLVPKLKNDFILRMTSRLKKLKLSFRVFDAAEQTRLTAGEAIQKVSESYGLVLTILQSSHPESFSHNLRTMFVAGVAVGLEKPIVLLSTGVEPVPMDVAEISTECRFPEQIDEAVQRLAVDITEAFQQTVYESERPKTQLEKLDLGASSAENELSKLDAYYLATDAFQKTLRGEARLVVGRKGSGKSAVFFQVKNKLSQNKKKLILDLKPDGFQIITLKESLAPFLTAGSLEHLVTAFWEYVLFCEIGTQYLWKMKFFSKNDPELYEAYKELEDVFKRHNLSSDGDFSERIVASLKRVEEQIAELQESSNNESRLTLTSPQVTNIVHRGILSEVQQVLYKCLNFKDELWILFDNIDKGWPAHGLTHTDILVVRTLIDAARKVSRNLEQHGRVCYSVIFLRNDVFELLVSETPDRGKEARVLLDWNDRDALKELVRRRLTYSGLSQDRSLDELWRQIATPYINGSPSFDYLLDRCLMRPRFLLDLIGHCKSFAVNAGHQKIEAEDIQKGIKVFSSELVLDIGFEIADVLGYSFEDAGALLIRFGGCDQILHESEIFKMLLDDNNNHDEQERLMKILLWHGVIGISSPSGDDAEYIYDFNYNYSLMAGNIAKSNKNKTLFRINDAFTAGLQLMTLS